VDPSHATGKRDSVLPMARASIASGADGILVEVHHQPETALSDGPQSIYPDQFVRMMDELERIAPVVGRSLPRGIHIDAVTG
jgi:3-deoxy-7-phosphoheptulonate synthase